MSSDPITYDRGEQRQIIKALGSMSDEAIAEAKKQSGGLVEYLRGKIITASSSTRNKVDDRIASGSVVSKSSKIGELNLGFARQKFSGGGTTQINQGGEGGAGILGGAEFGSNKYKQFPSWSGKFGAGSRGWFIYPTLRREQPYIVDQWEKSFDRIIKEW
jgi:hypothetical protein